MSANLGTPLALPAPDKAEPALSAQDRECVLCALPNTDSLLLDLFEVPLQHWSKPKRVCLTEKILRADKRPETQKLTYDDVNFHFAFHPDSQPIAKIDRIRKSFAAHGITDEQREIVKFIAHAGRVRASQIGELIRPESGEKEQLAAGRKALRKLRRKQMIFKDGVGDPRQQTSYMLNQGGLLVLDGDIKWRWVNNSKDAIGFKDHDTLTTQVFLDLLRSSGPVDFDGVTAEIDLNPLNFYSSVHVGVAVQNKHILDWNRKPKFPGVRPDAFAAISLWLYPEDEDEVDMPTSLLLPAYIEYDRGTKKPYEVGDQVANYLALYKSHGDRLRFPQLDVEGFFTPLVVVAGAYFSPGEVKKRRRAARTRGQQHWVTDEQLQQKEFNRARNLRLASAKELRGRRWDLSRQLPPMFLAVEHEVKKYGANAPVYDLRNLSQKTVERKSMVQELFDSSRQLIESERVDADTILHLEPKGARWQGSYAARRSARKSR